MTGTPGVADTVMGNVLVTAAPFESWMVAGPGGKPDGNRTQ